MTLVSSGALVGLLAGVGLVLLASWARARRPVRLVARIRPFVGAPGAAFDALSPVAVTPASLRLRLRQAVGSSDEAGDRDLAVRLGRSGSRASASQYRLERLVWSVLGACAGGSAGFLLAVGGSSVLGVALLAAVGGVAGWSARDAVLRRVVRRRQRTIEAHLPALADLLALAVASGASPVAALERASQTMSGPLAHDVTRAVADIRVGAPVEAALRAFADGTGLASLRRLVDGVLVALERGTPLAEVMRAQASDVRADERRRLMELAGRKDVAMLVPIVFLVLPSVVLVAVFPGLHALRLVIP
jgi:tight adherence protein C